MSKERTQTESRQNEREEKRAQFTEGAGGGSGRMKLAVVIVALAALAGYMVFANAGGGDGREQPTKAAQVQPAAGGKTEEVRVPLKDLEGGKAVFFEPRLANGKRVRFFAVKAEDNSYKVALDACEVCFHAKKGYEQSGSVMVCRNCGRSFAIKEIGPHNEDGCHPIALKQSVEGEHIVVGSSELERGASYF